MSSVVTTVGELCGESSMTHGVNSTNETQTSSLGPSYCAESNTHIDASSSSLSGELTDPDATAATAAAASHKVHSPAVYAELVESDGTTTIARDTRCNRAGEAQPASTTDATYNYISSASPVRGASVCLSRKSSTLSHAGRANSTNTPPLLSDELLKRFLTTTQLLMLPHAWQTIYSSQDMSTKDRRGAAGGSGAALHGSFVGPGMNGLLLANKSCVSHCDGSSAVNGVVAGQQRTAAAATAPAPWIMTWPTHPASAAALPMLLLPNLASLLPMSSAAFSSASVGGAGGGSRLPVSSWNEVRAMMSELSRRRGFEAQLRLLPRHHQMQSLLLQECSQRASMAVAEASMRARLQSKMTDEQWSLQEKFMSRMWKARQEELRAMQQSELVEGKATVAQHTRWTEQEVKAAVSGLSVLHPRLGVSAVAMTNLQRVWWLPSRSCNDAGDGGAGVLLALMEEERVLLRALRVSATRSMAMTSVSYSNPNRNVNHTCSLGRVSSIANMSSLRAERPREMLIGGEDVASALQATALRGQWFRHCVVASFNAAAIVSNPTSLAFRASVHDGPKGFALAASRAGVPDVKVIVVARTSVLQPTSSTTATASYDTRARSVSSMNGPTQPEVLAWAYVLCGSVDGVAVQAEALARVLSSFGAAAASTAATQTTTITATQPHAVAQTLRPDNYLGVIWPKDVLSELVHVHKQQQRGFFATEEGSVVSTSGMTMGDVLQQSMTTLSYNGVASAELLTRDVDTVGEMVTA